MSYKFSLPISSSPSIQTFTFRGSFPSVFINASKTAKFMKTCPLSSLEPLAYIRPFRISGLKGSLSHSSMDPLVEHHSDRKKAPLACLHPPHCTQHILMGVHQ